MFGLGFRHIAGYSKPLALWGLAALLLASIISCGNKGNLYYPEEKMPEAKAPSPPQVVGKSNLNENSFNENSVNEPNVNKTSVNDTNVKENVVDGNEMSGTDSTISDPMKKKQQRAEVNSKATTDPSINSSD